MGKTIILNSTNIIPDGTNSRFLYSFPNGGYTFKNDLIAIDQIAQYNSVFNITAENNNNTFSYTWVDKNVYTVVIPNGAYSIPTLNAFFQSFMISKGTYYTLGTPASSTTSTNVYLMEFVLNPALYAVQLNCYYTSSSEAISNNWVVPIFFGSQTVWVNPTNPIIPFITIPATNLPTFLGLPAGNYPNATIVGVIPNQVETINGVVVTSGNVANLSFTSTVAPQVQPSSSYLVFCSLVNNRSVIPSNLIYAYAPTGTLIGQLGVYAPTAELCWNKVLDGNYNNFILEIRNQLGQTVKFQDPNTVITIQTKNRDEFAEYNN